jgi:hypothetical protein
MAGKTVARRSRTPSTQQTVQMVRSGMHAEVQKQIAGAVMHLVPWALMVFSLVVTIPLQFALHRWALWSCFCFAIATAIVTGGAWKVTHERGWLGRYHIVANVALPLGFLTYTIGFGWHAPVTIFVFAIGIALALLWNIRHSRHAPGEQETAGAGSPKGWTELTDQYLPDLKNVKATVLADDGDRAAVGLDLPPDLLPKDISARLPYIAKHFKAVRGGATMFPNLVGDKVMVMLNRRDPLKAPVFWPGPSAPGESAIEPFVMGRYRSGADVSMVFPHRNNPPKVGFSMLVSGVPGSGKTESVSMELTDALTRVDIQVVYLDTVKGDQSAGVFLDDLALYARSGDTASATLRALLRTVVPARGQWLADEGIRRNGRPMKNWEPGCGLSFLIVIVEEASDLAGNSNLTKAAERVRSLGVMIQPSMQRWHHEKGDTNLREACTAAWCFGMNSAESTKMVLPDDLMSELDDAENGPWLWGSDTPGLSILHGPGLPRELRALPMRSFFAKEDEQAAALAEYRHLREPLDPVTTKAFGDILAQYQAKHPVHQRPVVAPGHDFAAQGAVLLSKPAEAPAPAAPPAAPASPPVVPGELEDAEEDVTAVDDDDEDFDGFSPDEFSAQETREEDVQEALYGIADQSSSDPADLAEAAKVVNEAADDDEDLTDVDTDDEEEGEMGRKAEDGDAAFRAALAEENEISELEANRRHKRTRKLTREEKLAELVEVLRVQVGIGGVYQPKDLYEAVAERFGGSNSWVRGAQEWLQTQEYVEMREEGGYRVLQLPPASNAA